MVSSASEAAFEAHIADWLATQRVSQRLTTRSNSLAALRNRFAESYE